MNENRRFGKRIAEPSSVQIIHELKLMTLRQSLDALKRGEDAEPAPPGFSGAAVRGPTTPLSNPA